MNNKISKYFFYLFIFLLPWQTRLILFPFKSEYLGFSIYFSEILLWLALAFWLVDNYRVIKIERSFLFFYLFIFLSLLWAQDILATFRIALYIFEGILIFKYLEFYRSEKWKFAGMFIFAIFLNTFFAIWQFFSLGSPAFKWLGLAYRGAENLGDIVIETLGGRWLRAYGSFPHPNIFGIYCASAIILLFQFIKERGCRLFYYFILAILFFGLVISFSRSAWLAFAIVSGIFILKNLNLSVFRKIAIFLILLCIASVIIFSGFFKTRLGSIGRLETISHRERTISLRDGLNVWREHLFLGTGAGNFTIGYPVPNECDGCHGDNSQPPHNLFLIVLAELGMAGFLLYLLLWKKLWHISGVMIVLFFIAGFFDHYLWTFYPGQMIFWVGVSLGARKL